jgi:hypothetical protein
MKIEEGNIKKKKIKWIISRIKKFVITTMSYRFEVTF